MIIKCPACYETLGEGGEEEAASLARSHAHHCPANEGQWHAALQWASFEGLIQHSLGG